MDARSAAERWIAGWTAAWPVGHAEPLEAVYADEALSYSHPFREREHWRKYVDWAFAGQAGASCRVGAPVVDGDRAAVDWWGVITTRDGAIETVAGTSLLRFGPDGRVVEQRDAWASTPGRVELPHWPA